MNHTIESLEQKMAKDAGIDPMNIPMWFWELAHKLIKANWNKSEE